MFNWLEDDLSFTQLVGSSVDVFLNCVNMNRTCNHCVVDRIQTHLLATLKREA